MLSASKDSIKESEFWVVPCDTVWRFSVSWTFVVKLQVKAWYFFGDEPIRHAFGSLTRLVYWEKWERHQQSSGTQGFSILNSLSQRNFGFYANTTNCFKSLKKMGSLGFYLNRNQIENVHSICNFVVFSLVVSFASSIIWSRTRHEFSRAEGSCRSVFLASSNCFFVWFSRWGQQMQLVG